MKLRSSFTVALLMGCGILLCIGCQPKRQGIRAEDVPVVVMDNLTNSAYHAYDIEEIKRIEKPSGTYYVFDLKQNNNEVQLTFNAEGQLVE